MSSSSKVSLILFVCIFSILILHGTSTEFEVGEKLTKGWEVPLPKHPHVYNEWAQKNRFKVNDTLHFRYKKDSVMVVTNSEYDKCGSAQPLFFSNNGDTTFVLDRPGLFYFISGVTGHCPKGQKMIVKVLDVENSSDDDQQSGNETAAEDTKKKSDATQALGHWSLPSFMVLFIVGYHIMG